MFTRKFNLLLFRRKYRSRGAVFTLYHRLLTFALKFVIQQEVQIQKTRRRQLSSFVDGVPKFITRSVPNGYVWRSRRRRGRSFPREIHEQRIRRDEVPIENIYMLPKYQIIWFVNLFSRKLHQRRKYNFLINFYNKRRASKYLSIIRSFSTSSF